MTAPQRRFGHGMCYLCGDIARDCRTSGIAIKYGAEALERAFLLESDSFFVIPAPGTLAVGYLIIAARQHVVSFARLDSDALGSVEATIRAVTAHASRNDIGPYLCFEHGTGSRQRPGAACIDHAHLHICPTPSPVHIRYALAAMGLGTGQVMSTLQDLSRLAKEDPYLLIGYEDRWLFYDVPDDLPSQLIRRLVALQLGERETWNWRAYSFPERFDATRKLFEECDWTSE